MSTTLTVYGVATPYAWDVVESARRAGLEPRCHDNHGGADARLPGLDRSADRSTDLEGPFVLGLSSAVHRAAGAHLARRDGFTEPRALVDPTSVVPGTARIGHGAYVNAGVVIGSHAVLGCHSHVNRAASVGHDTVLEYAATLGPGALTAGEVHVGAAAFIGAGAVVLPRVRIGRRATVGAGAVVTKDVEDFAVVVGNPAAPLPPRKRIEPVEEDACPHC